MKILSAKFCKDIRLPGDPKPCSEIVSPPMAYEMTLEALDGVPVLVVNHTGQNRGKKTWIPLVNVASFVVAEEKPAESRPGQTSNPKKVA